MIKVVKDPSVPRDDVYKSGTIFTGPGEPPSSQSRPTPRGRRVPGKPISQGKLLRPGGPGGGPSKLAPRPAERTSVPQPTQVFPHTHPSVTQPRPIPASNVSQPKLAPQPSFNPQPMALQSRISQQSVTQQSVAALNGISHGRNISSSSVTRAPPPPPPPPPPAARRDTYKALYAFAGQSENELTLEKNEIIEILQKETNGKQSRQEFYSYKNDGRTSRLTLLFFRLVARQKTRRLFARLGPISLSHRRSCSSTSATPTICRRTTCTGREWLRTQWRYLEPRL